VTLQTEQGDGVKPLGVEYNVKAYVADKPEERSHKRSSISLAIKKVKALSSKARYIAGSVSRKREVGPHIDDPDSDLFWYFPVSPCKMLE
jgi:hypothetical protein